MWGSKIVKCSVGQVGSVWSNNRAKFSLGIKQSTRQCWPTWGFICGGSISLSYGFDRSHPVVIEMSHFYKKQNRALKIQQRFEIQIFSIAQWQIEVWLAYFDVCWQYILWFECVICGWPVDGFLFLSTWIGLTEAERQPNKKFPSLAP